MHTLLRPLWLFRHFEFQNSELFDLANFITMMYITLYTHQLFLRSYNYVPMRGKLYLCPVY